MAGRSRSDEPADRHAFARAPFKGVLDANEFAPALYRSSVREAKVTTTATTAAGGGQVAAGAQLFGDNCESCHGPMGAGGHVRPDLQKSSVAEHLAQVEKHVRHGGGANVVEQSAPKA
jgi:mono/diheme cytochrome c family protein